MENKITDKEQVIELKGDIKYLSANLVEFKAEQKESMAEIKQTLKELAGVYTTKEEHRSLVDKVNTITWALGVAMVAIVGEAVHIVFQILGRVK